MKGRIDFIMDTPGRLLCRMAVPAVIAMVVNGLYYLVDAAFVGWQVGADGLAGLAIIFPVQMFTIAWGAMIGMGTAAVVSRLLGENRRKDAERTAGNSLFISILSGVLFTFLTFSFQNRLIGALGGILDNRTHAVEYLRTLQWGFGFVFLSMTGFNLLRTQGEARSAARGMLLGTAINLILDPLFITSMGMGVKGAALATVIARMLSTLYFFVKLKDPRRLLRLRLRFLKPEGFAIRSIFALGLGNFLGQFCLSLSAVVTNNALRIYGNALDLAAFGVISRILVFITMPLLGIAQGFQAAAGYNYGAGEIKRVKQLVNFALIASFVIGTTLLIPAITIPEKMMGLFSHDKLLTVRSADSLRLTLIILPFLGFQIIGFSLFQAIGRPLKTLMISISRQLIFLCPLLFILPPLAGRMGVWMAYPLSDALSIILSAIMISTFWREDFRSGSMEPA